MDVKTTFLHRDLEEEIYMKQLEGFVVKGKKELVCKLKKSLYGLKHSPRMWYQKYDTFILGLGFTRSKADHCVYFKLIGSRVNNLYALEVQDACKALRSKATDGDLVVERESTLPINMKRQKKSQKILEEPQLVKQLQDVVEQPQLENPRGD